MQMTVSVLVSDVLCALDLDNLPEGSNFKEDDYVNLEANVDDDEIIDASLDSNKVILAEDTELSVILDRRDIEELSAAIRRGDTAEAELMLDRVVAEDPIVRDWVEQARYSRRAKAPAQALRKAA